VNGRFIITFVKDENKAKRPLEGSGTDATPAPSAKNSPRVKCEKIEGAILMANLRGDLVLQVQFMESLKAFD
jgi:hypothetical protein